jgi:hypothetical protein
LTSFGFSPIWNRDAAPEAGTVLLLLDSAGRKISQLEEAVSIRLEEEGRALALSKGLRRPPRSALRMLHAL